MTKNNIKNVANNNTIYTNSILRFCTVFLTLQEIDFFVQRKRLHFVSSKLTKQNDNKSMSIQNCKIAVNAQIRSHTTLNSRFGNDLKTTINNIHVGKNDVRRRYNGDTVRTQFIHDGF